MQMSGECWKVVGGADRGGILVRESEDVASPQLPVRLGPGAIVEQVELIGLRLHFRKVSGTGPASGWVSTRMRDTDLLLPFRELSIVIFIDQEINLQITKQIKKDSRLVDLKTLLVKDDLLGEMNIEDLQLSLSPHGNPLPDNLLLTTSHTELHICSDDQATEAQGEIRPEETETHKLEPPERTLNEQESSRADVANGTRTNAFDDPRLPSPDFRSKDSSEGEIPHEDAESILAASGDPRKVLGVSPNAGSSQVRRAYHRLALIHHPDKAGSGEVFRVIAAAYERLTSAKQEEQDGWHDLDGQAVGPFVAHTHAVPVVLFDCFCTPPWESRRLYTGCWQEGRVSCWELSAGHTDDHEVSAPPRLIGHIEVGGFLNDIAALSPHGIITAQSAGYLPQPGESLRCFNLNITPFQLSKAKAITDGRASNESTLATTTSDLVLHEDEDESNGRNKSSLTDLHNSEMVYLHYRGVRRLALWPRPESHEAAPHLVATISSDMAGVSRIRPDGCGLDANTRWKMKNPHAQQDCNGLCWGGIGKLWTGGNDGCVKLWDVDMGEAYEHATTISIRSKGGSANVLCMEAWPDTGVLACGHSHGITFVDSRAGKVARTQFFKTSCKKVHLLREGHPMMFAGVGNDLTQYDTRMFADGADYKSKAVAQWTLGAMVESINCTTSSKGHLLVAVGCADGKVAAFDTV